MQPLLIDFPEPDKEAQACDRCPVTAWASFDGLHVLGWIAYNGFSFTGKPLRVRICPTCRSATTAPPRGPLLQVAEVPLFPQYAGEPERPGA